MCPLFCTKKYNLKPFYLAKMEKMKVKKWKSKSLCTRKNVDSFHQLRSTNIKKRTRRVYDADEENKRKMQKRVVLKVVHERRNGRKKLPIFSHITYHLKRKLLRYCKKKNFLKDFINKNMSGIHLLIQFTLQIKKLL